MADDWAVKAAKVAAERDHTRQLNLEKNEREAKLKDQVGAALFGVLQKWIHERVGEFNSLRKKQDLTIVDSAEPNPSINQLDNTIRVNTSGEPRRVLLAKYSQATHTIQYECGGKHGEFVLKVSESGASFESPFPHQEMKQIEEIGEELLNHLLDL